MTMFSDDELTRARGDEPEAQYLPLRTRVAYLRITGLLSTTREQRVLIAKILEEMNNGLTEDLY